MILLHVISPTGTILKKEVDEVHLRGVEGPFTVLDGHAPMIAALKAGKMRYSVDVKETEMDLGRGFAELEVDNINLCVD